MKYVNIDVDSQSISIYMLEETHKQNLKQIAWKIVKLVLRLIEEEEEEENQEEEQEEEEEIC